MKRSRKILYFIIYWLIFSSLIIRYVGYSNIVGIATDIFVLCLVLSVPYKSNKGILKKGVGMWIPLILSCFLVLGAVSGIIELNSPFSVFWGLRMQIRYILLFYGIVKLCNLSDVFRFKHIVYKAFRINVFFCILQYIQGQTGDWLGGTFTGNGDLTLFLLIFLFLKSGDFFQNRIGWKHFGVVVFLVFLISMVGEIKMMYFVIPVTVYCAYILIRKFSIMHIVILAIGYVLFVPALEKVLSIYYDEDYISKTVDVEEIQKYNENSYGFTEQSMNRSTAIEMSSVILADDQKHELFGFGIGTGSRSEVFSGPLFEQYAKTFYYYFTTSYVMLETGWVGFMLYILFYVLVLIRFWHYYRTARNKQSKYWASMGVMAALVTFLLIWYNPAPYVNYYFMFAFWGFCLVGYLFTDNKTAGTKRISPTNRQC